MTQQTNNQANIMESPIKYELLDHGIDHAQYFQGCGCAFTPFDNVATGCGDNFAEALNDALEQIAMSENAPDVEALEAQIRADEGYEGKDWPTTPSANDVANEDNDPDAEEDEANDHELYYYVSIRY